MEFKKIDDTLSVAGQLSLEDLTRARDLGFKTIINVRPDGEKEGAMTADEARVNLHNAAARTLQETASVVSIG